MTKPHWVIDSVDVVHHRFCQMTVYYGDDCQNAYEEATDEHLKEIWDHWLSPNGKAYYR